MEELLKKIVELRKKTQQHYDEINQLLGISPGMSDPRNGCFVLILNNLTLTLELLAYYQSKWSKPPIKASTEEIVKKKKENAERCITITRWLFMACLSSMEYSAKESVAFYGGDSPAKSLIKVRRGQHIYLSSIVRNSKDLNLIDDNECNDWQTLIFIRNCVVHNNAYSDIDNTIDIGGTRIIASAGKMIQGNLDFFTVLIEVAIERYFAWVKTLIKEYGK